MVLKYYNMKKMEKIKYLGLFVTSLYMILACSKMNDKHDIYLQDGEIVYIGRVDSARILSGKERFKLRYWITDPRAKELKIYWDEKNDSAIIMIPEHKPTDSIDVIIGDDERIIPENNYVFHLIATDGNDLKSVSYEQLGNVYGEKFKSTIVKRFIKEINYNSDTNQLIITWQPPSSSNDIGVEITYFEDEDKQVIKSGNEDSNFKTTIENLNIDRGISYRTMYLPGIMAIDTFFTSVEPLKIIQNIALNKSTVTSSFLNGYPGSNAIDGDISTMASRWIDNSPESIRWIEIDLGGEFNLVSFELYKHLYDIYFLPNFIFQ